MEFTRPLPDKEDYRSLSLRWKPASLGEGGVNESLSLGGVQLGARKALTLHGQLRLPSTKGGRTRYNREEHNYLIITAGGAQAYLQKDKRYSMSTRHVIVALLKSMHCVCVSVDHRKRSLSSHGRGNSRPITERKGLRIWKTLSWSYQKSR